VPRANTPTQPLPPLPPQPGRVCDLQAVVTDLLDEIRDGFVFIMRGAYADIDKGDLLLIDRARKRPKDGDLVMWQTLDGDFAVSYYFKSNEETLGSRKKYLASMGKVWGIATGLLRCFGGFSQKARLSRKTVMASEDARLSTLRKSITNLERLPENETERFKLEIEIYQLENATSDDEWPDEIGEVSNGPN
jgi:hypothetical protein